MSSSQPIPPRGFVHLILLSQDNPFYLEIPIEIGVQVCVNPLKYLKYLGWCVLGVDGILTGAHGMVVELNASGELLDQGVYHYNVQRLNVLAHAVDLEVIKQRSRVASQSTGSCENFHNEVIGRDGVCVWTGEPGSAMHIIPRSRGDEWLELIVANRPHDESLGLLTSINDIRNGMFADDTIHNHHFEPRNVVILKTPNPILQTNDIPERFQRNIEAVVSYPADSRYTLQWIVPPMNEFTLERTPNNNDATFMNHQLPKPADVLLHYNYGAAAVKHWGRNTAVLTKHPDLPCPSASVALPMGPPKSSHDRKTTIPKLDAYRNQGGQGAGMVDPGVQNSWDEHDVMLFFWGNSKVAQERYAREKQERTKVVEAWRAAIPGKSAIV